MIVSKSNIIEWKSYKFAINIIHLYKDLNYSKKEYILSKQILKSGTSIGANVKEAINAFSKKEFISKLGISYKEAHETIYWLNLLKDTDYIDIVIANKLISECQEIIRIIIKIQLTAKKNLDKNN